MLAFALDENNCLKLFAGPEFAEIQPGPDPDAPAPNSRGVRGSNPLKILAAGEKCSHV
jgi:hypothetical protein